MRLDHLLSKGAAQAAGRSRGSITVLLPGGSRQITFPVAIRLGGTPVPIPNTMVKTQAADGTVLETVRESRRLPELKKKIPEAGDCRRLYDNAGLCQ